VLFSVEILWKVITPPKVISKELFKRWNV